MSDNEQQDALDWCHENLERVEALAESDRAIADYAQDVLDYLRDGQEVGTDEFEDIAITPLRSYLPLPKVKRRAQTIRDVLTDEAGNGRDS